MGNTKYNIGETVNGFKITAEAPPVIYGDGKRGRRVWAICPICGNGLLASMGNIVNGGRKSCGCLSRTKNTASHKHGMWRNLLFTRWQLIRERCYNKNNKFYKDYGGRGIKMCDEWRNDFKAFHDYVTSLPNYNEHNVKNGVGAYTIDRIDNDGNYEPGNIRWATMEEQNNNRRSNNKIKWEGKEYTLMGLLRKYGLEKKYDSYLYRFKNGWSIGDMLNVPLKIGNNQSIKRNEKI